MGEDLLSRLNFFRAFFQAVLIACLSDKLFCTCQVIHTNDDALFSLIIDVTLLFT